MKKVLSALSISFILPLTGFNQNDTLISAACIAKIDSTYNALLKANKVVGTSIALVKDGKVIYATGYGFQDREGNIKATENTVYRIGSCSKSFTALSLLQLQERGKVNLADPIQKYLPQLTIQSRFDATNPISIRSILSHSSGLPNDLLNGFFCDNPPSIDWLIEQVNKCTMASPANYYTSYSNIGYGILGKLITDLSGLAYGDYVKEHIFTPLNMTSSFLDDKDATSPDMSVAYVNGKPFEEVQIRDQAAGLIASSASDMANYLNMFLSNGANGTIISEASLEEMQQNATAANTLPTASEWGYGLYADHLTFASPTDTMTVKIIGHGGDTWAFHADFQFIPELNVGAVVLTNTDKGIAMSSAKRLLNIYLREMEGKKQILQKKEKDSTTSRDQICNRNEVTGDYYLSGMNMHVSNPAKIKMKQGMHTIRLNEVNDLLYYKGKIYLFSLIPVKVKHQEFKFVKLDNDIYLKVIMTRTGNEEYAAIKSKAQPITASWKNKFGKYVPAGEVYACTDCPFMNFKGIRMTLKEKKGKLVARLKTDDKSVNGDLWFEIVSDELAVTPGIGRNTGETLRILENGNLFYSGFEFKLK